MDSIAPKMCCAIPWMNELVRPVPKKRIPVVVTPADLQAALRSKPARC